MNLVGSFVSGLVRVSVRIVVGLVVLRVVDSVVFVMGLYHWFDGDAGDMGTLLPLKPLVSFRHLAEVESFTLLELP